MLKRVATVSLLCVVLQTVATVFALSVSQEEHSGSKDNTTSSKSVAEQPQRGSSNSSSSLSSTSSSSSSSSSSRGGPSKPPKSKKHFSKSGNTSGSRSHGRDGKIARFSSFDSDLDLHWPIGYRYKYASDYDSYVSSSYSFLDLDTDFGLDSSIDLHEPIWFPLHYDVDLDLDLDLDDIDLDLDLLKLKYGLYGLNHYSLHNPRFNDYRFRSRYRSHSRPYFRAHHRYLPQYWKHDLDFWGLDNYGLGFGYDKYLYLSSLSTPTSYSHISTF